TAEIAQEFPVIYISQPNRGPAAARNTGISASKGDLVAFFDHDDLMMPGKLETQAEYLLSHSDIGFVLGREEMQVEPGFELPDCMKPQPNDPRLQTETLPVVRREVLAAVGGFDPDLWIGEDTEWIGRALAAGFCMHICDQLTLIHRFHGSNLTYMNPGIVPAMLEVLRRVTQKRRLYRTAP
ncbi:MAG: glycosyltransferase family A protein, partial [Actinomycetota bacterium]